MQKDNENGDDPLRKEVGTERIGEKEKGGELKVNIISDRSRWVCLRMPR